MTLAALPLLALLSTSAPTTTDAPGAQADARAALAAKLASSVVRISVIGHEREEPLAPGTKAPALKGKPVDVKASRSALRRRCRSRARRSRS